VFVLTTVKDLVLNVERNYTHENFLSASIVVETMDNTFDKLQYRIRLRALKDVMESPKLIDNVILDNILENNNICLFLQ